MPDTGNAKDYLELPPTSFSIFALKNVTWRTYLISFTVQYCFLFRFVCIELASLIWFLQIWVSIFVYGTMINWSTLIKKLMQTFIVKVSGSILNISTVHLNGIHRRTGRGGEGGLQPPQILGNSDFLGSKRKFGQSYFLKTFPCFFISLKRQIFSILIWKKSWSQRNNPVTFSRDTHSGCWARDEFLVIAKGIICWFTYL